MTKKILHLTLKRFWFDRIAMRLKYSEYREIKPYWNKRLFKNGLPIEFDEVHFRNGYKKNNPFMRIGWVGIRHELIKGKNVYAILLGKILEIKNWKKGATIR